MYQSIPDIKQYKKQERDLVMRGKKAYLTFIELDSMQEDDQLYSEGYKTYTGYCLTHTEAEILNNFTKDLNRTTAIHMRNYFKDKRHQSLCLYAAKAYKVTN